MTMKDQDLPPLWQFIPVAQRTNPPAPASEKVRRGMRGLLDRLGLHGNGRHDPVDRESLRVMGSEDLGKIVAPPAWQEGIRSLDDALRDWLASAGDGHPLMVLVAPPNSGVRRMVEGWAVMKNWPLPAPPDARSLLGKTQGLLRDMHAHSETPVVLSRLEKWYLRHHNGLGLMRELLDHLCSRRALTLVCCDSWAWAYLNRAVHLDLVLPSPLVPAAFHVEHLRRWFTTLVQGGDTHPCVFRHPETGKLVLNTGEPHSKDQENGPSDFLSRVAAYARGIPGVAHALWRYSLRLKESGDGPQAGETGASCPETVWVKPWQDLDLPRVPKGDRHLFAFLLHALLLHDGLSTPLLAEILQCLPHPPAEGLQELRGAGLVFQELGVWQVSALGYPAARDFLQSEEYLVDQL